MREMSIGEVSARTGLPASTLRYYEEIGVLPAPRRASGQRRYGQEMLRLLALIQVAKQANFSLAEIRDLLGDSPHAGSASDRWRALASQKMAEADAMIAQAMQIKQVVAAGAACRCDDLDSCDIVAGF